MTDKKESILAAALELFANDGYNATSTSKIAKKAGVSEGLIFRHFENKKGLLVALAENAQKKFHVSMAHVLFEEDPKETIRLLIQAPFKVPETEYDFWKLQFKLKWEKDFKNPAKMKPLVDKLTWAFTELGYDSPQHEAKLLIQIIDSVSISFLRDEETDQEGVEEFLLKKYHL